MVFNQIPIENYVKQKFGDVKEKTVSDAGVNEKKNKKEKGYNFDKIMDYYLERDEFTQIVGIIDKNLNPLASMDEDLFKIRPPRAKVLEKKRGTGIPTLKGAVCNTSKSKPHLLKLLEKIPGVKAEEINNLKKDTRESVCDFIKIKLLYQEKYSTSAQKNKVTYVMIPSDHPIYPFPFNLEDRIKYILSEVKSKIGRDIDYKTIKENNGTFQNEKNLPSYKIEFNDNKYTEMSKKELEKIGFNFDKNKWYLELK